MQKAYKFRLYPNNPQQAKLAKFFGHARFVWNSWVASFNSYDVETKELKLPTKTVTELKAENIWLSDVSCAVLQQKQRDFMQYTNQRFSKTRKSKLGSPKFKSRKDKQSFRLPNQKFKICQKTIQLEKLGYVKCVYDRVIPKDAKLLNVTVSRDKCGAYYASILVEQEIKQKVLTGKTVGIDVGIKSALVTSDGEVFDNPRYLCESQARIVKLQRQQSRKQGAKKGQLKSTRWLKLQKAINRQHRKVTRQRENNWQNITTDLIARYDTICIEDLNITGMLENHCLAKSIADVSWNLFFTMLEYKAKWYGKEVIKINRFAPSSKACSVCGHIKQDLTLANREWECPDCHTLHNRDFNAAQNIKSIGVNIDYKRTQSREVTNCEEASRKVV